MCVVVGEPAERLRVLSDVESKLSQGQTALEGPEGSRFSNYRTLNLRLREVELCNHKVNAECELTA